MEDNSTTSVYAKEIYHGLPVIPSSDRASSLTAIVVGASGMSGQSMIDILNQNPQRWKKVYALSRRSPQLTDEASNVEHVPVDLLHEPSEIATTLRERGVTA